MITLASIHKVQGLEWIWCPIWTPLRIQKVNSAKAAALVGDTSQFEQEWNLKYVADEIEAYIGRGIIEDFLNDRLFRNILVRHRSENKTRQITPRAYAL